MDNRIYKEISDQVFGKQDYEPVVTFFDHPAYDEELSEKSGRPRFTEQTYTLLKPTHPDLKVRDEVSHPVRDHEIERYPEQWAAYQKTKKEQAEFKPCLQAIPGMKVSYFRELQALEIFDAEALANYDGDLGEINHLKDVSVRIMEISNEAQLLHQRREKVREDRDRRVQHRPQVLRASEKESGEKESQEEKTFSYDFQVSY